MYTLTKIIDYNRKESNKESKRKKVNKTGGSFTKQILKILCVFAGISLIFMQVRR
jgi:hypothetical protein